MMARFRGRAAALLAMSALVAGLTFAPGAQAKKKAPPEEMSAFALTSAFRAAAAQAQASIAAGNLASAQGQLAALKAMASVPAEKYVAGQLQLQYSAWRGDVRGQRLALSDILDSGGVPEAAAPRLRYLAAYFSSMLGEQNDAIAQVNYARQLGYVNADSTLLLADAMLKKTKGQDGLQYADQAAGLERQAGQALSMTWYDKAAAFAYQGGKWPEVARWYQEKLAQYPSAANWRTALVNYLSAPGMNDQPQIDLYRLMAATGALASERDYQAYATLASSRGYDGEAKTVIDSGRAAGKLTATDPVTVKLLKAAAPKAVKTLAGLPAQAKKATAATSGSAALAAGELYLSIGQYPQAAVQLHDAIIKGGVDDARARTRLGIALARSGDLPGAREALSQVPAGSWTTVAGFWAVWVDLQVKRTASNAPRLPVLPAG